jgi:hypothetical protein
MEAITGGDSGMRPWSWSPIGTGYAVPSWLTLMAPQVDFETAAPRIRWSRKGTPATHRYSGRAAAAPEQRPRSPFVFTSEQVCRLQLGLPVGGATEEAGWCVPA